jgi:hypothetical protein
MASSPEWTTEMARSMQPNNPWMAAGGASSEHNDAYSSNVSPQGCVAKSGYRQEASSRK